MYQAEEVGLYFEEWCWPKTGWGWHQPGSNRILKSTQESPSPPETLIRAIIHFCHLEHVLQSTPRSSPGVSGLRK